jgi:hypothetical protein
MQMDAQDLTKLEPELEAEFDRLLADASETTVSALSAYWAQSASASVLRCYKEGRVIDIKLS